MKGSKKPRQFDIDEKEALSKSNNLEVSALLHKYDQEREKQLKKINRKLIMSDMKENRCSNSPEFFKSEDGLVTKLSQRIERLNSDVNDRNYKIRELTAEVFNWKQKFNELKAKFEKSVQKKKLLKQYLKEKVEALVTAEDSLAHSNEVIQELNQRYETINVDKDRIEDYYRKEFENIVETLSSMKVYDQDTIESDSLLDVINRSLRDIKEENRSLKLVKQENERLLKIENDYYSLKHTYKNLKSDYDHLVSSKSLARVKKQLQSLVHNKLEAYRSEITFLKSSFKSELTILKSGVESVINNVVLKSKEILMNAQFERDNQWIVYKQKLMAEQQSHKKVKDTQGMYPLLLDFRQRS